MKKVTRFLLFIIIFIIIVSLLLPCIFIYVIANVPLGETKKSEPADSAITYGEIPFELFFEINGEIVTIQDSYVCEYKGAK